MNAANRMRAGLVVLLVLIPTACNNTPTDTPSETASAPDPFALPAPPPSSVYDGPLFANSVDYPDGTEQAPAMPWRDAIGGGAITVQNANAYVLALKSHIADDMKTLLFEYPQWDAAEAGWYNQPWESSIREPIHGTFVGSTFDKNMFPQSGLTGDMTTHVLTLYDETAGQSLGNVWGDTALDPEAGIEDGGQQIPEGGIVVKPAFTTADGELWPPMDNAYAWEIYAKPGDGSEGSAEVQDVSFFQFDIIVKDSVAAPKTQWVFSTLVYDKDAPGDDWDKMIPLGAMWGNDPTVMSPEGCNPVASAGPVTCPALSETWINPDAPVYATETLGWGGRLSGPNDGAVDTNAAILQPDGTSVKYEGRYAMSSCMSCHGPAEYPTESFLLPVKSTCSGDSCRPDTDGSGADSSLIYYPAGSAEFMRWFQDRAGDVPQDEGSTALDYDMDYAFKALPIWFNETDQEGDLKFIEAFNDYRGLGRSVLRDGKLGTKASPSPSASP